MKGGKNKKRDKCKARRGLVEKWVGGSGKRMIDENGGECDYSTLYVIMTSK